MTLPHLVPDVQVRENFENLEARIKAVTPASKPTVTGSRGGNAALASLLAALAALGYITDGTTA